MYEASELFGKFEEFWWARKHACLSIECYVFMLINNLLLPSADKDPLLSLLSSKMRSSMQKCQCSCESCESGQDSSTLDDPFPVVDSAEEGADNVTNTTELEKGEAQ